MSYTAAGSVYGHYLDFNKAFDSAPHMSWKKDRI